MLLLIVVMVMASSKRCTAVDRLEAMGLREAALAAHVAGGSIVKRLPLRCFMVSKRHVKL